MIRIITTLCAVCLAIMAQGQYKFTLEQAIAFAMDNSNQIKLEKKDIEDAEGQILEYKSIGIPKIDLGADYTYFPAIAVLPVPDFVTPITYDVLFEEGLVDPKDIPVGPPQPAQFGTDQVLNAGVTFNTLLFDFSFFQGLKAQEMFRELVVRELDVTEYQVRSGVTRAYMAVLISRRQVSLIDNNLSNIESLLTETSALYENGFSEKLDVDRLVLSKDNLLVELEKAKRGIDITENILKFQMGFPASEDIELTDTFDELADQFIVAGADLTSPVDFNARPEYRALSLAKDINEVNQKVIKAGYMPSLSANAGYSQQLQRNVLTNSDEAGWFPASYLGVSLKMPIFDGLERKAKLDRAKVSSDQAEIRIADFENSMIVEVENARISYVNAIETVYSRRDAMALAQSIYDTTQIKYKEGVGSSVELTQAESELYTTQSNYINALYDLLVAKTDLDIALGKM